VNIPNVSADCDTTVPRRELVGRTAEQAVFDQLLANGRTGHGAALRLSGEPGIGKSALLDYAARQATGYHVIRAQGAESEMDFPYAGLQLLCMSVDDSLRRLASPQREALETAVGLRPGAAIDRFLVGLGLHALLSTISEAQPVLCLVDDVQWLDRPSIQVLTFVARRLTAESVVLLTAQRQREPLSQLAGLPELTLEPISDATARTLFATAMPGRVDHAILARIIAEARGNPQSLMESVDGLSPAEFSGGLDGGVKPRPRLLVAEGLRTCMSSLPSDSRQLLVVAAAEPIGDPALMWQAAAALGIPTDAVEPLEASGLLSVGSRVLFARPLLRSMVYGAAAENERRRAHRALAEAAEQASTRDCRAWHRGQASTAPDEEAAAELERCAAIARERAGVAASAAFLERAALLTPHSSHRADRLLTAAAVKLEAGDPHAAARLAVIAEMGAIDQSRKDRVTLCRAQIASAQRHGSDAPELLLTAARRLAPAEPAIARETHLEALAAALRTGRFGTTTAEEIAASAASTPAGSHPSRAVDLLLDALAGRLIKGYGEAVQPLKGALEALQWRARCDEALRWLSLASRLATDLWDDRSWHAITALQLRLARETDALAVLPDALADRAVAELNSGDFAAACALVGEADALMSRMETPRHTCASLVLAAWRGHDDALGSCEAAAQDAYQRADGTLYTTASYSAALLYNGRRRYEFALTTAQDAAQFDEPGLCGWALVELIEAAVRRARLDLASLALERLSDRTRLVRSDWAAGTEARCRALLARGSAVEDLYVEAIERLKQSRLTTELARAQLLYGEWLRREGRRIDARKLLRMARESFVAMGAKSFAERAHLELLASGETARSRAVDTQTQLTPQEARVALLARDGLTNPEIGERLFVSPKTVEYHLRKVFAKLRISSRKELHLAFADADSEPQLASVLPARRDSDTTDQSQCA
jgi:DNA-binding CsgD family transcriptional regulator